MNLPAHLHRHTMLSTPAPSSARQFKASEQQRGVAGGTHGYRWRLNGQYLCRCSSPMPNVRWISEPDRGQSDAINKGFRQDDGGFGWLVECG